MTKEEFNKLAQGLPFAPSDLSAEVVHVEPVDAAYFRNESSRQRCIVRKDGKLFVSYYD